MKPLIENTKLIASDKATEDGPELQLMWPARHLFKGTIEVLITAKNSETSYLTLLTPT